MSNNKKVILNLKLDAPVVYAALENLTEISQDLVSAALDGDDCAIAQIADFKLKQSTREANADQVFSNLKEGMSSMANVVKQESDFIDHANSEIQGIANNWSKSRLADRQLAHNLESSLKRSDYELIEADVKHQRRLNLLTTEHQTNIRLIDIDSAVKQHQIKSNVRHSLGSSPVSIRAGHHFANIKNL
ncbi:MAG: hypothetical protein ACKPE3_05180, partial [Sphaerospermopsis kisseleviana]